MFSFFKKKKREVLEVFEGYVTDDDIDTLRRNISNKANLDILTLWLYKPSSKSVKVELRVIREGETDENNQ